MIKTIYQIPAPYRMSAFIEVYGDPDMAWFEWRIIDGNHTEKDTGDGEGCQYGQAEIALRDALIFATAD